ncbi:cell envelope integrity protein TolA [Candidatus Paracaedibacter symbiosus]|uniref:cell envelope integrity protein TolA n=1 Tax=Candidatus Paracaedibacter symbiosus TaxID=244582 RepID=UPI00068A8DC4|nr:cell envelope integrity protein TolA [Candidatus Paracaedibacter symbiosus]
MKRPATYSALMHLAIFVLLAVGFYNPFKRTLAEQKPLMIEFVNISDISQAPVLAPQDVQEPDLEPDHPLEEQEPVREEPKPEPPVKQESLPEQQKESTPTPEPEAPKPEPIAEPIPDPKPKTEEKKEEKKPEPPQEKPIDKQEEKKEPAKEKVEINLEKKKLKSKVEDKKDDKKKLDDLFKDVLDDVIKDDKKAKPTPKKKGGKVKGAPADKVGDVVTGTEIDAIRRQIARCWIVPNGARDVQDLIVDIEMKIAKDGTVLEAKVSDNGRMARDQRFRAAADSATRAVLDPKCNPLPLNPDKYEEWKDLEMSFNPKDMY